jgi:polyhydroxyalkanoate synthase
LKSGLIASNAPPNGAAKPDHRLSARENAPQPNGSLPFDLADALDALAPETFLPLLEAEARSRFVRFLDGVERYRRHPYRRALPEAPVLWREGTTSLRDYAPGSRGFPALFVPSLVNRAYILDLTVKTSLLRWLAQEGFRPLLVDWDAPGTAERSFTLSDYIAGRLEHALDAARKVTGRAPVVAGYCMGGLLALPLALRRPDDVAGLALLATPWDFHAGRSWTLPPGVEAAVGSFVERLGVLPVDAIQALFAALDPQLVVRKFQSFATLVGEDRVEEFVALEDWLNDGVPLAGPVARECLLEWYGLNTPGHGTWAVAGRRVDPGALAVPVEVVIPAHDRIVPPDSARALLARLPGARIVEPPLGHIGMIVGRRAREAVWHPFAEWLRSCAERRT